MVAKEKKKHLSDKSIDCKRPRLCSKQTAKKEKPKRIKKCTRVLNSSTTTDTDVDMSVHDDSDLFDVLSDPIIDDVHYGYICEPQILQYTDEIKEQLQKN